MESLKGLEVGKLSYDLYLVGLESFVICTVDFVLKKGNQFFLIKRNEGAFADEWFVAGGRQNRGENEVEALYRIAKRELGVNENDIISATFSHCQDVFNGAGKNVEGPLPAWHSKWHFYVVEVASDFEPRLDTTSSEGIWFTQPPPVPEPVHFALKKAKII